MFKTFSLLQEILEELRRIRFVLEGGLNPPLPGEDERDESQVLYTDDTKIFLREIEEERFYALKGRPPSPGERLPGPTDEDGREWIRREKALEGDAKGSEMGLQRSEGAP